MKNVQVVTISDLQDFAAKVYANGKTASERFGMTWDMLSELEEQNPKLTNKLKSPDDSCQVA
ncbi:hypothetical protein [Vibrio algicola]|uniref:Uncharacterized protein n=1 Tax=Vibrio algicola TaxID=2662262 RepID=A0A5Q0TCY6_9VIBR|nr:hypothetical protein [Vibrio algicola]